MKQAFTAVVILLLCSVVGIAQDVRAISGGTSTQPDPKDKSLIQIVAETDGLKLTLGKSHLWNHKRARVIGLYLKVENRTDKPLAVLTSKFSAVDGRGQGYAGLETEEAIKRFNDSHGLATAIIAGPFMTPAIQANTAEAIRRESLISGDVPARSFKEGMIFFEAPKEQHYTLQITLTDLWLEPFVFSTEKHKKK